MSKEKLYTVAEFGTNGWSPVSESDVHLNREDAQKRLDDLIHEGYNPNRLKAFLE